MRYALVTGTQGFLGRETAQAFARAGYTVIGVDRRQGPSVPGVAEHHVVSHITVDALTHISYPFAVVVHCAGGASVRTSVTHPKEDFDDTVVLSEAMLEYVRQHAPQARFLYPSSAAVYGVKPDGPISETSRLDPVSPYGLHKKIVEELATYYAASYGLSIAVVRFFSLYGEGLQKQLLWDAAERMASDSSEAVFWGDGTETRDWLHVSDAAQLFLSLSERREKWLLVNGGSGVPLTIQDVLERLKTELHASAAITFNRAVRTGDPKHYVADVARARALGWQPIVDFQTGMRRYAAWYMQQRPV